MKQSPCLRTALGVLPVLALLCCAPRLSAANGLNPIGKLARFFNPELVKIEDRISWLDGRLTPLAKFQPHTMRAAYGFRGARLRENGPEPEIVFDLGKEVPIDHIYLIPAPPEPSEPDGLFPRRFTLSVSNTADFAQSSIVYGGAKSAAIYPNPGISPERFSCRGTRARYVKLSVQEGFQRGVRDLFALSEVMILSETRPVSFNAAISTNASLTIPGAWAPEYLVDGRSPLGIWQGTTSGASQGDLVETGDPAEVVSWSIDLDAVHPIGQVVLYPYELPAFAEGTASPQRLQVWASDADGGQERLVADLSAARADMSGKLPLVIPLRDVSARRLRISSSQPVSMGGHYYHGFSEIEVWNGRDNLASGQPVIRHQGESKAILNTLTDRIASQRPIFDLSIWLNQLNERKRLEQERNQLQPLRNSMASESELNATWGLAVAVSLTFLIPVAIIERRRLVSRNQIEMLRKRIASDLHDDIGSNLGCITLIAGSARKDLARMQGPDVVVEDLGEVETIARESSLAMRDIVWLLERRQDSIGDLAQRMKETAGRLLREIDYTIECRSAKATNKLTLDAKRHLFLFYKEAIHNVVKHSRASHVSIILGDLGDNLVLEVKDNGVGLPADGDSRQASVRKLQDRAHVLEGDLQIESATGTGTLLRLVVKRSSLLAPHPALSI